MKDVGISYGILEYFMTIWYTLWPFSILYAIWYTLWLFGRLYVQLVYLWPLGTVCGHLEYFPRFGMLYQ
jgi:hypothetical protein